jgi:hypothetical protein
MSVDEVSPWSGRKNVPTVSRGLASLPSPPVPSPARPGEGCRRRGKALSKGLRPRLQSCAPEGAGGRSALQTSHSMDLADTTLTRLIMEIRDNICTNLNSHSYEYLYDPRFADILARLQNYRSMAPLPSNAPEMLLQFFRPHRTFVGGSHCRSIAKVSKPSCRFTLRLERRYASSRPFFNVSIPFIPSLGAHCFK